MNIVNQRHAFNILNVAAKFVHIYARGRTLHEHSEHSGYETPRTDKDDYSDYHAYVVVGGVLVQCSNQNAGDNHADGGQHIRNDMLENSLDVQAMLRRTMEYPSGDYVDSEADSADDQHQDAFDFFVLMWLTYRINSTEGIVENEACDKP